MIGNFFYVNLGEKVKGKKIFFKPEKKKKILATDEKTSSMREDRQRGERTKHATLARQTAGRQRWLQVVVTVVCADVVPKVRGATGHPEGRGTEEARAERACVKEEPWECGVKGRVEWKCER